MGERTPLAVARRAGLGPHGGGRGHHQPAGRADRAVARQAVGQLDGGLRRAGRGRGAVRNRARRSAWSCARRWASRSRSARIRCRCARSGPTAARRKKVTSPVSLIVTAFATLADVRGTLTPQLDATRPTPRWCWSTWAAAGTAWAAASWRRRWARAATRCPTWTTRRTWCSWSPPSTQLRAAGQDPGLHDRSDGGLFAAACEMAFAGHVGVALNVDMLVTEGDGISDSRAEYGDAKNWAGQVERAARGAHAQGAVQRRAGRAAAGAHRRAQRGDADAARARPVASTATSSARPGPRRRPWTPARARCRSGATPRRSSAPALHDLHQVWDSGQLEDLPASATTRPAPTPSTRRPASRPTRACTCVLDASTPPADVRRALPRSWRAPGSPSCASRASTRMSRWPMPSPRPASRPSTCT